ncbi:uncharacterized protein LOC131164239 [Malania oleifera]|uniref:uncharacterized protein LOC131164239 n=1 Tax=Malania oleifera TaxID=397392 RepID=UPI0025AECCB6|nr:uncharacterized protein LOC131164239 [Malania oleifera]
MNQQALIARDDLHMPSRPITRARAKKVKEAMQGLIEKLLEQKSIRAMDTKGKDFLKESKMGWFEQYRKRAGLSIIHSKKIRFFTNCFGEFGLEGLPYAIPAARSS